MKERKIQNFIFSLTLILSYFLSPKIAHASIVGDLLGWGGGIIGSGLNQAFVYILSWLSSFFISIFGWLLMGSANLFNALIQYTIVDFGGTLDTFGIINGINTVWSAFRDISNIVIIGMFVFVAISMIIGLENYGTKRFVVRILIIAVLINFSLLFTKLIIDTSHIAARQFYNGIVVV